MDALRTTRIITIEGVGGVMQLMNVIEKKALKFGQEVVFYPLYGNKRKVRLNRTRIIIKLRKNVDIYFGSCEVILPSMNCEGDFLISYVEEHRYFKIESLEGGPFLINGSAHFSSILLTDSYIDLGLNRIAVSEPVNKKLRELPLDDWPSDFPILLEGETGCGKTSLARKIHDTLHCPTLPFIHLNLSSFNESLLESEVFGHEKGSFTGALKDKVGAIAEAGKGTLFLDEIDSLSAKAQVKILTFLDDKKYRSVGGSRSKSGHCRIIFASGQSLKVLSDSGGFRSDLYYRINSGLYYRLPSLSGNSKLIENVISKFEVDEGVVFSKSLLKLYGQGSWPGNYRELLSHLRRKKFAFRKRRVIEFCDLDSTLVSGKSGEFKVDNILPLRNIKKNYCEAVLLKSDGHYNLAASKLKVSPSTLRRIISA